MTSRSQPSPQRKPAGRPRDSKLDALAKILKLEESKGFSDKAVGGGLDKFLNLWAAELRPVLGDIGSYSELDVETRRAWMTKALQALENAPQGSDASVTPVPAKPIPKAKAALKSGVRRPAKAARPAKKSADSTPLKLTDGVDKLYRMRSDHADKLEKLGIVTVRDLIYHFPFRHN
ncbi:MAG: hypothetical protein O2854_08310, partial [Chloroflexi bacterium]|nr:hypothetical protein [Chloroflexota bacterium]